jgi:thiamine-phosphate pyrophosphorylase
MSDDGLSALIEKITRLASAGIDWVQLREKDLSARDLANLTRKALRCARAHPEKSATSTRIVVNDRADVARAEGADGVHLGENSLPVREVKSLVAHSAPSNFLVGVSCHSLDGAKSAKAAGADYVFFGPVFATPSKAAFGEPQGSGRLGEVCRQISIPVIAIGGVTLGNAPACFAAGAAGIAAIRLFQDPIDPASIVEALRKMAPQ